VIAVPGLATIHTAPLKHSQTQT